MFVVYDKENGCEVKVYSVRSFGGNTEFLIYTHGVWRWKDSYKFEPVD